MPATDDSVQPVLIDLDELGVLLVTLNRPSTRNALNSEMSAALSDAFARADNDDETRVVVVTGIGDAFCAGADFSRGSSVFGAPEMSTFSACPISPTAFQIRKPVIAAVNGHAIGIGLTMALHCDIRVMARHAKYGVVQVRRGVAPDAFSHWTLPRIAGMASAADILLTGRTFDGDEALRLGIASRAVENADVLPTALDIARDIAENTSPLSVALTKRLLWESFEKSVSEIGQRETADHLTLMGRPDAAEGVSSFLERRPPQWQSRVPRDWSSESAVSNNQ